jgi:N-acyl-L-homoserine lactone synthetase
MEVVMGLSGSDEAGALDMVDGLARQLLRGAAPLRFGVAQAAAERAAAYRLRYQVVTELGWASADDFPDGLERDEYDERAVQVIGWDGETPIATAQLVFPAPGLRLPTEAIFGLVVEPQARVVDWGHLCVASAYRHQRHLVSLALMGCAWLTGREQGYHQVCGRVAPHLLRLYEQLGIQLTTLGPARLHWGEERFPVRFDILGSVAPMLARLGSGGWQAESSDDLPGA